VNGRKIEVEAAVSVEKAKVNRLEAILANGRWR
jgi:hypothetical protein